MSAKGVDMRSFGEVLRDLRESRNITQHRLGLRAQVSPSSINRIEKGERGVPEIGTLTAIASALALSREERLLFIESAISDSLVGKLEELILSYLVFLLDEHTALSWAGMLKIALGDDTKVQEYMRKENIVFDSSGMYRLLAGAVTAPSLSHVRRVLAPEVIRKVVVDMEQHVVNFDTTILALGLAADDSKPDA